MANVDNVDVIAGVATYKTAAHGATYSGDEAKFQIVSLVYPAGAEGSKTVNEIHANGIPSATAYGLIVRIAPTAAPWHIVTAATTNAQTIKGSAGAVRSVHIYNAGTSPVYVKFHNTASTPTPGVSIAWSVGCQAGTRADVVFDGGVAFTAGISMTVVKGLEDSSVVATTAGEADVLVRYE